MVAEMERQLLALRERADDEEARQHERSMVQRERLEHAARELAEVGQRLEAAATMLREWS